MENYCKNGESIISNEVKWQVYESNLQTYRSCMISSQSFLVAACAFMPEDKKLFVIICAGIAIAQLWFIWFGVIRCRTLIVDFYKYGLGDRYNSCGNVIREGCTEFLTEEQYVHDKAIRRKVNQDALNGKGNIRMTRKKLDIFMPISFSAIWIVLFLCAIFS